LSPRAPGEEGEREEEEEEFTHTLGHTLSGHYFIG